MGWKSSALVHEPGTIGFGVWGGSGGQSQRSLIEALFPSHPCITANPCLPRAPRPRISDTDCVSTIIGRVFSYQPSAVELLTSPSTRRAQTPLHHRKSMNFEACFQSHKTRKNCPMASKKSKTSTPKSMKNDFREKLFFAIL